MIKIYIPDRANENNRIKDKKYEMTDPLLMDVRTLETSRKIHLCLRFDSGTIEYPSCAK